jgi:hypothetical protein
MIPKFFILKSELETIDTLWSKFLVRKYLFYLNALKHKNQYFAVSRSGEPTYDSVNTEGITAESAIEEF